MTDIDISYRISAPRLNISRLACWRR